MKATEKFKQDFRTTTWSRQEKECHDTSTLLSSNDVLIRARLTYVRFGLTQLINKN